MGRRMKPADRRGQPAEHGQGRHEHHTHRKERSTCNASQRPPRWSPPKGTAALMRWNPVQAVVRCVAVRKESTEALAVFSASTCRSDAESTCTIEIHRRPSS